MPSIGITSTDIAEPANATTEEFTKDVTVETVTIRNNTGATAFATALKYSTTTFTRRGRGAASLADVVTGDIGEGVAKITSVRNTETADDFPSYEISAVQKDDLP
tara:strand:+ start:800 stop:1114 length:315 start_codon:yes stop_codon:yes gene_type:complete